MNLDKVRVLSIPKIPDERGNISFLQNPDQIPFEIKKVYWINDVPSGAERDGQANKDFQELVIALSGSFDVMVNDGENEKCYSLNRPDLGLHIPGMIWRSFVNFSTNSVVFVVTDQEATDAHVYDDFTKFQSAAR